MNHTISLFRQGVLEQITVSRAAAQFSRQESLPRGKLMNEEVKIENPRNIWGIYTEDFSNLTPDRIKYYLETARLGVNWFKSSLFEEIRRKDLRLGGICQTRKYSVAKMPWEIEYPEETAKENDAEQKMITDFMRENFKRIKVPQLISDMVEAQIQGVSTFEINYDIYNGRTGIKKIKYIPNHLLLYDDIDDQYLYLDHTKNDLHIINPLTSNFLQDRFDVRQIALPNIAPLKILEVHALDGNASNGFQNGCIDSLIWAFFLKNYGLKDFAMYIERLGIPAIIAKYDPLMSSDERSILYNAIKNWGHLFKLMIPNSAEVDLLTDQTKSQSGNLFKDFIQYINDECSIRVLGQTLTTSAGDIGSQALGTVHNAVREDLVEADKTIVIDGMNEIIRKLGMLNFPGKLLPEFGPRVKANVEYQVKRSEIYSNIKKSGYRVTRETIESEMELQVEEDVQEKPDIDIPDNDKPDNDKPDNDKPDNDKPDNDNPEKEKKNKNEKFSDNKINEEIKKRVSEEETQSFLEKFFKENKPDK